MYPSYGYAPVGLYLNEDETHGEIVHCLLAPKNLSRFDDPTCDIESIAILCNNCGEESGIDFLKGLCAGQVVPIKFMGELMPIVPREWLLNQPWLNNNDVNY